jgi:hypothetical protein
MGLDVVLAHAVDFDKNCQLNIETIGDSFQEALAVLVGNVSGNEIIRLSVLLVRFVIEYDISVGHEIPPELVGYIDEIVKSSDGYSPEMKAQIDYAQRKMPAAIMKHLLNADDLIGLRNVQQIARNMDDRLSEWKAQIGVAEERVDRLKSALSNQEQHFNFVGLSEGFSGLAYQIEDELKKLQIQLRWFGGLLLLPVISEFVAIVCGWVNASSNPILLGATAIASVTATLLLLYFFRITLHNADSCRAQLIQVRLRMTLCQFIQSYATYSTEIKAKNAEALSKFESLIFSGIVSKDDKLPSTFDGVEQLSGLLSNLRSAK